jgi:hypothetical protein
MRRITLATIARLAKHTNMKLRKDLEGADENVVRDRLGHRVPVHAKMHAGVSEKGHVWRSTRKTKRAQGGKRKDDGKQNQYTRHWRLQHSQVTMWRPHAMGPTNPTAHHAGPATRKRTTRQRKHRARAYHVSETVLSVTPVTARPVGCTPTRNTAKQQMKNRMEAGHHGPVANQQRQTRKAGWLGVHTAYKIVQHACQATVQRIGLPRAGERTCSRREKSSLRTENAQNRDIAISKTANLPRRGTDEKGTASRHEADASWQHSTMGHSQSEGSRKFQYPI